jgi:DNA-binding transcriptional LysR family regulator
MTDPPNGALFWTKLRQLNLNHLPILEMLLRTRSVSETATLLGLTQPAVSRVLSTMRSQLDDPLLVRAGGKMALTRRASNIAAPLSELVAELSGLLDTPSSFDPKKDTASFRIATIDYATAVLAPALFSLISDYAPNITVEFTHMKLRGEVDIGQFDFVIVPSGAAAQFSKSAKSMPLWQDQLICLARSDDETIGDTISAEDYSERLHAAFHISETPGGLQALIHPTSRAERDSIIRADSFLSLIQVVESVGCLAIVPKLLVPRTSERNLRIVKLTGCDDHLAIQAFWSATAHGRMSHVWFRQVLREAASQAAMGSSQSDTKAPKRRRLRAVS